MTRSQSRPIHSPERVMTDLVVGKLDGASQRVGKRFGQAHARQQPHDRGGAADHARQHAGRAIGVDVSTRLQQRDTPHRQPRQHVGEVVEFVDAQRFEVIAERGFDRALPAALNG